MSEEMFYIHDTTRGCVGNSMVWWKKDHHGYTCDIRQAHIFSKASLDRYLSAGDLVAYPVDYIKERTSLHVDMQCIDRGKGIV